MVYVSLELGRLAHIVTLIFFSLVILHYCLIIKGYSAWLVSPCRSLCQLWSLKNIIIISHLFRRLLLVLLTNFPDLNRIRHIVVSTLDDLRILYIAVHAISQKGTVVHFRSGVKLRLVLNPGCIIIKVEAYEVLESIKYGCPNGLVLRWRLLWNIVVHILRSPLLLTTGITIITLSFKRILGHSKVLYTHFAAGKCRAFDDVGFQSWNRMFESLATHLLSLVLECRTPALESWIKGCLEAHWSA